MRRGPLSGRSIDGHGHARTVRISSNDLLEILLAGDFDPILRAEFVAAVRAADERRRRAARATARAAPKAAKRSESSEEGIDVPLYYATTCEEEAFPWSRTASPQQRLAQARAQARRAPGELVRARSRRRTRSPSATPRPCAFWPFATPGPPVDDAPLPNVPTLILSGADDLRTPTSDARAVAAQIPDAHLLVVPNTGHSVLTTEPTACAREALNALFAREDRQGMPARAALPAPATDPAAARATRGRRARARLPRPRRTHAAGHHADARRLLPSARAAAARNRWLGRHRPRNLTALDSGGLRAGWAQLSAGGIALPRLHLRARRQHLGHRQSRKRDAADRRLRCRARHAAARRSSQARRDARRPARATRRLRQRLRLRDRGARGSRPYLRGAGSRSTRTRRAGPSARRARPSARRARRRPRRAAQPLDDALRRPGSESPDGYRRDRRCDASAPPPSPQRSCPPRVRWRSRSRCR